MELVTPDQKDALLEALEDQGRSCYCPVAVCARWILLAILQKRYEGTREDGERDGAMYEPVLEDDGKQLEKQVRGVEERVQTETLGYIHLVFPHLCHSLLNNVSSNFLHFSFAVF